MIEMFYTLLRLILTTLVYGSSYLYGCNMNVSGTIFRNNHVCIVTISKAGMIPLACHTLYSVTHYANMMSME